MLRFVVAVLALVAVSHGFPTGDQRTQADKDLLVSDMRLVQNQIESGIIGDNYRWPNRQVIYQIDPAFSQSERSTILAGIQQIKDKTCITFAERSNQANYVFIQRGGVDTGCWSYVGKTGGRQILNLQVAAYPGAGHCIWAGTVSHELIHAIGYYHEQSRPDRDDYVNIIWDNIPTDVAYNFDKYRQGEVDTFGVPYDYSSIMHYDAYAFAIDRSRPTIVPKQGGAQLGNDKLTANDARKINNMYKC